MNPESYYHLKPTSAEQVALTGGGFSFACSPAECALLWIPFKKQIWYLKEPSVEITANGQSCGRQHFGQKLKDWCLIDLSHLAKKEIQAGSQSADVSVHLDFYGMKVPDSGTLMLFEGQAQNDGITLIVAPHPDDGELCCSSFYGPKTFLLTLTAGDKITDLEKQYYKKMDPTLREAGLRKGLLRAWNAVTAGMLGGLSQENMICLGYRDGCLEDLLRQKETTDAPPPATYRLFNSKQTSERLGLLDDPANTFIDLKTEVAAVISRLKPRRIVVTSPFLESHRDHLAAGRLLLDMKNEGLIGDADLLFYTVHTKRERDIYFGPAGSRITLPRSEKFEALPKGLAFSYVSRELDDEAMKRKAIMMNCMHDLYSVRDHRWQPSAHMPYLDSPRMGKAYYFRRFVKKNEVFLKLEN
ncbi:MAG: PIG-L family deacetylase [Succinivibrionaceae bacterium]|nr:PIG-L family deacetylase [Succinivibrionaceae bacterium]